MPDFWIAFIAGLASGVVLAILTTLLRRFVIAGRADKPNQWNMEALLPAVPIVAAVILVVILALYPEPILIAILGFPIFILLVLGSYACIR